MKQIKNDKIRKVERRKGVCKNTHQVRNKTNRHIIQKPALRIWIRWIRKILASWIWIRIKIKWILSTDKKNSKEYYMVHKLGF